MIEEIKAFQAKCDKCGKYLEWYGEGIIVNFETEIDCENSLRESEWETINDKHYCSDCWEYDDNSEVVVKGGE